LEKLPELDDYSAMLTYTQEVKENAGVTDSYTEEKSENNIQEDENAKKVIEKYESDHEEEVTKKLDQMKKDVELE